MLHDCSLDDRNIVFKELCNLQYSEVVTKLEKLVKSKDYCSWKGRSILLSSIFGDVLACNSRSGLYNRCFSSTPEIVATSGKSQINCNFC